MEGGRGGRECSRALLEPPLLCVDTMLFLILLVSVSAFHLLGLRAFPGAFLRSLIPGDATDQAQLCLDESWACGSSSANAWRQRFPHHWGSALRIGRLLNRWPRCRHVLSGLRCDHMGIPGRRCGCRHPVVSTHRFFGGYGSRAAFVGPFCCCYSRS